MGELYRKLKQLDPKIADLYFKLTKDDPKAVLDTDAIQQIFGQALDQDQAITPSELDALIALFEGPTPALTPDAKEFLAAAFADRLVIEALGRGKTGKILSDEKDLAEVFAALDAATTSVNFTSPGTKLTYSGSAYQGVKQLVKDKEIFVFQVQDKGLAWDKGNIGAAYDRDLPHPVMFLFEKPQFKKELIAHEMTHAVQDWNDVVADLKYTETDAILAQGLVNRSLGRRLNPDHPLMPLLTMVVNGEDKSKAKSDKWRSTYEAAANAVATDPNYARQIKKNPTADMKKGDEKKDQIKKLLDAIKKSDHASAPPKAPNPPAARP